MFRTLEAIGRQRIPRAILAAGVRSSKALGGPGALLLPSQKPLGFIHADVSGPQASENVARFLVFRPAFDFLKHLFHALPGSGIRDAELALNLPEVAPRGHE